MFFVCFFGTTATPEHTVTLACVRHLVVPPQQSLISVSLVNSRASQREKKKKSPANLVLQAQRRRTRPLHVTLSSQWPTEVSVYRTPTAAMVGLARALPVHRADTPGLFETHSKELRRRDGDLPSRAAARLVRRLEKLRFRF